tara:strand:- start:95 stop:1156 length:1062 start_codon:yes stop_codon:yes gene_type:complete
MKAALFSMGSESSNRILAAMKKQFEEVKQFDIRNVEMRIGKGKPQVFYDGKPIENGYDCVYLKSSFRYALIQRSLAGYFVEHSYLPVKPSAYTTVNDKMLTHLALEAAGIPTPETYITPTVEAAKKLLGELNFPIILKIPGGTHGKGVMFAESVAAASGILDTLSELKQAVLMQEYVETNGTDIRAIVVGDKVVAAMVRKADKEDKRANIHLGGKAEAIELDSHTKKVALNTAKALGAHICAVDILESVKGPLVLEANISPGLQGIMEATGRDIPQDIAKFLRKATDEHKKAVPKHAEELVKEIKGEHQIIGPLDFRGERILLKELATKISGFNEDTEVLLVVKKGRISIEKV